MVTVKFEASPHYLAKHCIERRKRKGHDFPWVWCIRGFIVDKKVSITRGGDIREGSEWHGPESWGRGEGKGARRRDVGTAAKKAKTQKGR